MFRDFKWTKIFSLLLPLAFGRYCVASNSWVSSQIVPALNLFSTPMPATITIFTTQKGPLKPIQSLEQDLTAKLTYELVIPQLSQGYQSRPLILYLTGNNGCAAYMRQFFIDLSQKTQTPWLCINYPGVAGSQGFPWNIQVCVEAIIEQLNRIKEQQGWLDRKVLVIGHSLGGYIGTQVAAKLNAPVFVDRSLTSPAIFGAKLLGGWHWVLNKLSNFYGWEQDPTETLQKMAAKGIRCVVANHEQDFGMAPNIKQAIREHDETGKSTGRVKIVNNGPLDARIKPQPGHNLVTLSLIGGLNGHNAPPNEVQVKLIKPGNNFLGSPPLLIDAIISFVLSNE